MEPMKGARPMRTSCPERSSLGALTLAVAALILAVPAQGNAAGVVVSLSLSKYGSVQTLDAGQSAGVRPQVVHVKVGQTVTFVNDDTDHHTATSLLGASTFIDDPRWTDDALHASGAIGPGFWSTGDLAPGQRSAPLLAKQAGTYLFGCFFDYGAGMRGEIVVEP